MHSCKIQVCSSVAESTFLVYPYLQCLGDVKAKYKEEHLRSLKECKCIAFRKLYNACFLQVSGPWDGSH